MQEWIAKGYDIVAMVPSCALMLKQEWPLLVPEGDPARPAVDALAKATFDLTEFVVDIAKKQGLAPGLMPLAGPVALHLACHARAQNMGAKAADMLRLLPQAQDITVIERCSGHGGSWGVKKENFETALKVGKPATRKAAEVLEAAAEKNQQRLRRLGMPARGRAHRAGHLPPVWRASSCRQPAPITPSKFSP